MADGVQITYTGLNELIVDLDRAARVTNAEVGKVVVKAALNIKKDWQQRWAGLGHAPALASAVSFDVTYGFGGVKAEIGPDKGKRQGALGNLLEFGSVNNGPRPGGLPALDAETPRLEKALGDVVEKLLNG